MAKKNKPKDQNQVDLLDECLEENGIDLGNLNDRKYCSVVLDGTKIKIFDTKKNSIIFQSENIFPLLVT